MNRSAWIDLATSDRRCQEAQADVCVIGAGAAGIYLATQLARQGCSVVLIEAGPATGIDAGAIGFDALFEAAHYPGATAGRFFGMGGSTSRWGGQLVPHTDLDLRDGAPSSDVWSHIVRTVSGKAPQVLRRLGYRNGWDYESCASRLLGQAGDALLASGIHVQAALALPFRLKNLVRLLDATPSRAAAPRVFFNAVVKSWTVEAGSRDASRVTGLIAASRNHNELAVKAGKFVIAAGAIESARILLEIDESTPQPVLRPMAAVGRYLADHLSVAIADVAPESIDGAARLFAPRFSGAWMRSFRFLEAKPAQDAPRAFAHFIFSNPGRGFELAKELLGAVQRRSMPHITAASVALGLGDLTRLAYSRLIESVLYIPAGVPVHLQLDMEQAAVRDNHVSLARHKDAYGRRVARIHWQLSDDDMAQITTISRRLLAKWPGAKAGLPQLQPRDIGGDGVKPHDAYHPVGTCRIGEDAEAVVDRNLRVWGVQNLWVASTGVLPSAGSANPTFTMLCLTHQLAEHLQSVH